MTAEPILLASRRGFEIRREGGRVIFLNRRTSAAALVAWLAWGLAALFSLNGLAQLLLGLAGPLGSPLAGLVLLALAAPLGALGRWAYRRCKARCDQPASEVPPTLIADLAGKTLRGPGGEALCPLSDASFRLRLDPADHMEPPRFTYFLILEWHNDGAKIFKGTRAAAEEVKARLLALGIGSR